MKRLTPSVVSVALVLASLVGCSTVPKEEEERKKLAADVRSAMLSMTAADPSLQRVLDQGAGYALFPSVGKGALGVGGAYGRGHVYQDNEWIGHSDLKQATIGLQVGGQTDHELIIFQNQKALDRFKTGQYSLAANVSAVILKANAAAAASFNDGVLVLLKPEGGAMVEAAIGGQKFSFAPKPVDEKTD